MWRTEEMLEAQRLRDARVVPRIDIATAEERSGAASTEALRFELRYRSISPHRCGYAFPCDANGQVDLDQLSERARENYFYARAMVGLDLLQPEVSRVH